MTQKNEPTSPDRAFDADPSRHIHLTVCVLASGSKGNAVYLSDGVTAILIDAGLSGIEIQRRLQERGLSASCLNAIIVSHEHTDHIRGVGVIARRFHIPVYLTEKTKIAAEPIIGALDRTETFVCGTTFRINALSIHPFSTSHDAVDPAGFTFRRNHIKVGLATDLGIATGMVKNHLKDSRLVIVEANHDVAMLENGPYPWPVKQRIKSRLGHLSNTDSRDLLGDMAHPFLEHVILGHLSDTNNTPEQALRDVAPALSGLDTQLHVALQDHCGDLLCIK
jgi:phosphoribosyl 1,2-cyclic phosphodiesterase